ncbi:hypothetical protein PAPHI01_0599 [Pancytospora philotis]|nr:hypothetical protein PAPHI01_0599 [Pancytospora philotis]
MCYIEKPVVVKNSSPAITVSSNAFFYTFDGRCYVTSAEQTEPFLSMPYAITALYIMQSAGGRRYAITLNSMSKLECVDCDEISSGPKQCVTKNVRQVICSAGRVFYLFKKDDAFFINEVCFEGERVIGKHVRPHIKAAGVSIFAANGSFLYAVDGELYNARGEPLHARGFFAWSDAQHVVVASAFNRPCGSDALGAPVYGPDSAGIEINLYSSQMQLLSTFTIRTKYECTVRCAGANVVVQNEDKFYVLAIARGGLKCLDVVTVEEYVPGFDVAPADGAVNIYALIDRTVMSSEGLYAPLEYNFYDKNCRPASPMEQVGEASAQLDNERELGIPNEDAAASLLNAECGHMECDAALEPPYGSLDYGLEALRVSAEELGAQNTPRNYLFDAVKKALIDRREDAEMGRAEPVDPLAKIFPVRDTCVDMPEEVPRGDSQEARSHIFEQLEKYTQGAAFVPFVDENGEDAPPGVAHDDSPLDGISQDLATGLVLEPDAPRAAPSVQARPPTAKAAKEKGATPKGKQAAKKAVCGDAFSSEIQDAVFAAVENAVLKNEEFIKDLIARALVPSIEAAINEMRLQVVAEVRKMDVSSKLDPFQGKSASFKKLLAAGKYSLALSELVKLKGHEFESLLALIQPGTLEDVNPNTLALFIAKLHALMKKSFKEAHAKLLYDALVDIEIGDLTIDSLQSLSIVLRYTKELVPADTPIYAELGSLVDFICKKIKRRIGNLS